MSKKLIFDKVVAHLDELDRLVAEENATSHDDYDTSFHSRFVRLDALVRMGISALGYTPPPAPEGENIRAIMHSVVVNHGRCTSIIAEENARLEYERVGAEFVVSIDEKDVERLQELINESRGIIRDSGQIEEKHKRRLNLRLEALQAEMHKVKSDVDVALAGLVEVAAALGEAGEKSKPLFDRFKEIAEIFQRGSKDPLGLPSPPKQLPAPESPNEAG